MSTVHPEGLCVQVPGSRFDVHTSPSQAALDPFSVISDVLEPG